MEWLSTSVGLVEAMSGDASRWVSVLWRRFCGVHRRVLMSERE